MKIKFSVDLNEKKLEQETEKVESMNNIMATDEYHVKLNAKVKEQKNEDGTQHIKIKYDPECTK